MLGEPRGEKKRCFLTWSIGGGFPYFSWSQTIECLYTVWTTSKIENKDGKLRKCLFSSNKVYSLKKKNMIAGEKSDAWSQKRALYIFWTNRTDLKDSLGLLEFAWLPQNRKRAWLNGWAAAQWSSDFCTCKNSSVASAETDRQAGLLRSLSASA